MSLFAACLRVIGLSTSEASSFLSEKLGRPVSHQTIRDMSSGRSKVHQDIWEAMRELYFLQVKASEKALDIIEEKGATEVDYMLSKGALDWPSERVRENVSAMVLLADNSLVVGT